MGQYHYPVNITKREFITPHAFGDGLKLWEQAASGPNGVGTALIMLLAVSNGRGGGDFGDQHNHTVIGRWGGDEIAIIGDYAEPGDLANHDAQAIYESMMAEGSEWRDISDIVAAAIEDEFGGVYVGTGWKKWVEVEQTVSRWVPKDPKDQSKREMVLEQGKVLTANREVISIQWPAGIETSFTSKPATFF